MTSDNRLDLVRPVVAEIDGSGFIVRMDGGYGGFLGRDPKDYENTSVFDHLEPAEGQRLAEYFIQNSGGGVASVVTPLPFRMDLLGADSRAHPVDIIPTAYEEDGERAGWIVVVVPVAMTTAVSRSLEAEMAQMPREHVRKLLASELAVEGSRWAFVDLSSESEVTVTDPLHDRFGELARTAIAAGWRPWELVGDEPAKLLASHEVPAEVLDEIRALGFERITAAPVRVGGVVSAAYLNMSALPDGVDHTSIKVNVMDRIKSLVDVTSLVLSRWQDRDDLELLARSDALTGLANRQSFDEALRSQRSRAAVVYIDIDNFKAINDTLGHPTGDRVLQEVANRIVEASRPSGLVARLGGDEFAVLLDGLGMETARVVGERIVQSVREPMPIPRCGPVTVSVGLANFESDGAVDDADRALLTAKRNGRDQLVIA